MLKALTKTMMMMKVLMFVALSRSPAPSATYRLQERVDSSNNLLKFDFLFQASMTATDLHAAFGDVVASLQLRYCCPCSFLSTSHSASMS